MPSNVNDSTREAIRRIKEAKRSSATGLDLSRLNLTVIPDSLTELTNLRRLDLRINQITAIPDALAQLTELQLLYLGNNQITAIPDSLAQLGRLDSLTLDFNRITAIPDSVTRLTNLTLLNLSGNQITVIPDSLARLADLCILDLNNNQITVIPDSLAQLAHLRALYLSNNRITTIPDSLAQLTDLWSLYLSNNRITTIPDSLAQLTDLRSLFLGSNQITAIPDSLARLTKLESLSLADNQITVIPDSLAQLAKLESLSLADNQITTIPDSLAQLTKLETLFLSGNPLAHQPPEVLGQGTHAILAYLRARALEHRLQWISKLLIVGEGGSGKTSLLRALKGECFNPQENTTHGIRRDQLLLPHPERSKVTMQLNTWDFGGQQIYHATHQFFLTAGSLYLLVWNARLGFEQGNLYYWLDTIRARAPESPILLVATYAAEGRPADLPLTEIQAKYPQIAGSYAVSNRDRTNVPELREAVAKAAARLPLMGESWPGMWLRAAEAVRSSSRNFITASALQEMLRQHLLDQSQQRILSRWLHELGDIVYFQDDLDLQDTVMLRPDWVTAGVARVLDSDAVARDKGVFTRECMDAIWNDLEPNMREHFLRLMERFDLSYRTLENREISIVVERLPWEPPAFEAAWKRVASLESSKQVSMKFLFGSTLPAGLPTWFLARSHRFSTHTHWRQGALLQDGPGQEHLALIQADAHSRTILLQVRGPVPQNFFALLRDGLELTVARFPGLQVTRLVPCPGHDGMPCSHEFDYADLERAIRRQRPVLEMQCPVGLEMVPVTELLFGIHWSSQGAVIDRIDMLEAAESARHAEAMHESKELRELVQREFLSAFRRDQENPDTLCPNVFVLSAAASSPLLQTLSGAHGKSFWREWADELFGAQLDLQLCCQMPGAWHPSGEPYTVRQAGAWLKSVAPYLKRLVGVLKYAAPLAGPTLGVAASGLGLTKEAEETFKRQIEFTKALIEKLPEFGDEDPPTFIDRPLQLAGSTRLEGTDLRTLRHLLDALDPAHQWGGLTSVWTPEGHCLWLCRQHAQTFRT